MNIPLMPWIVAPIAIVLIACAGQKSAIPDDSETQKNKDAPQLVGRIASIPADKRFVLIQSYGSWNVQAGTILTTRGPQNRSANLLATGESLGHFAAADLQSGLLEIGDAVYSQHVPKPTETPPEPETTPELPELEDLPEF